MQISLKAARVNAGYSQSEVASIMNVSRNTIINWEKGRSSPRSDQFKKMSSVFNTPVDNIFLPSCLLKVEDETRKI